MTDERTYCIVPDCNEQPYPGNDTCDTHLAEETARERRGDRCSAPWAPFNVHSWKDGQCIHCGDSDLTQRWTR